MKRNSNTFITFTVVLSLLLSFTLLTCRSASHPTLKEVMIEVTSHNDYEGYYFLEYEGQNTFSLSITSQPLTIKDEFISRYDIFDDTTSVKVYESNEFDSKLHRLINSSYYGVIRTDKGVVIFTSDQKIDGNELSKTLPLIKKSL
jgi:hypothetical protein